MRGCIIRLIATVVVVPLALVLIIVPLILIQNSNNLSNTTVFLITAVPMLLFFAIIFGGCLIFIVVVRKRRSSWLDAIFGQGGLGLEGRSYLFNFRQYHGQLHGRKVDVYFYRGPTLDIFISTSLKTRFNIGDKNRIGLALARTMNRTPIEINEPAWQNLSVFALDADWMRRLLANPQAKTILLRLLTDRNDALFRQVHLQPEGLYLKLYRNQNLFKYGLTAEQVNRWMSDLFTLAQIAESLPAPMITDAASSLEQQNQSNRDNITKKVTCIMIVVIGLLVLFPSLAIGVALLITQMKN